MKTKCNRVFINTIPFQSLDTNVCGDYCVYYIITSSQGNSFQSIMESFFRYTNSHLRDHSLREVLLDMNFLTSPRVGSGRDKVHVQFSIPLNV